jgi:FeS assembly SUF system regulator
MIRVSRMADYGVVAMTHIARDPRARHTAASIAAQTGVPQPSASKLLKLLAKAGILTSHRGAKGGYALSRAPEQVSVAALVAAVDGPISLADCLDGPSGICELESFCSVRGPWQKISDAIRVALEEVTLADMAQAAAGAGGRLAQAEADDGREHAS